MAEAKRRSIDPASEEMLEVTAAREIATAWDRVEAMGAQCKFGSLGLCCRNCVMGPCRISPTGKGAKYGVCGATAETIVARNLLKNICVGAAAHSDHGRDVVHALALAAEGTSEAYTIKGVEKLKRLAAEYDVEAGDRDLNEIAKDLAAKLLAEFGRQHGTLVTAKRAPKKQQKDWEREGVTPRGSDQDIVSGMHATHVGCDSDPEHLILTGVRAALSDGWGGSMIATDASDILFGEPKPVRATANLGVLREDRVNLVVHGHEPTLSDVIVAAANDPELLALAKEKGAKGIQLSGICCTANEILMRHGIPIAGNVLQQELAIATGSVELMLVDIQCIFPAVAQVSSCFHTKVVSTSPKAKFPGTEYIEFDEERALEIAKQIVRMAIENFPNRDANRVRIPDHKSGLIGGFTTEQVFRILGGRYRSSYRPLNDGIMAGRIRGVAGVVGCNNPKMTHDYYHVEMVKELIRNDVLVVQTGCSAIACGKAGLMTPEAAAEYAGKGLQEICGTVGIPPVLHVGSCVDNSRILTACTEMVKEGGIGGDIGELPVAGAAPEWMSEKAISIGFYVVASGIYTVLGRPLPVGGSEMVEKFVTEALEEKFGGMFAFEEDPVAAARLMLDHIDRKRAELKLRPMMYEQPYASKAAAAAG